MQKRVLPESRALTAACSNNCGHLLTVLLKTNTLPLKLTMSKHCCTSARTHACHKIPTSSVACSHTCQGASKTQALQVSYRPCMDARQHLGCMGGDTGAGASIGNLVSVMRLLLPFCDVSSLEAVLSRVQGNDCSACPLVSKACMHAETIPHTLPPDPGASRPLAQSPSSKSCFVSSMCRSQGSRLS